MIENISQEAGMLLKTVAFVFIKWKIHHENNVLRCNIVLLNPFCDAHIFGPKSTAEMCDVFNRNKWSLSSPEMIFIVP